MRDQVETENFYANPYLEWRTDDGVDLLIWSVRRKEDKAPLSHVASKEKAIEVMNELEGKQ